ncbi:MAG: dihydropteroate synthase [Planktotalea sp.]|uniref:dihydropteroate synthase n=1 Tax=Planktotalea sp. TaxID=2029877 RepID=UPI003C73A33D
MTDYFRPLAQTGDARPADAIPLAGTGSWFTHVEHLTRGGTAGILPVKDTPETWRERVSQDRAPIEGLDFSQPVIMGILNVTPDSFSDGGQFNSGSQALRRAQVMVDAGAHLLDVGGESTRPGALEVPFEAEIARTVPVIEAIRRKLDVPLSIDTRKARVAHAALEAGANIVNDVSGFAFDPDLGPFCATRAAPVCLMHAQGLPETMQVKPQYDDVLLDVYDFLEQQIELALSLGLCREQIIVDPGLGFGKTQAHNLALIRGLSLFHGLGCPVLLGASRKGLIRDIGQAPAAQDRAPGSIAVALAAVVQGVQILRVHDVAETRQALALWQASTTGVRT